MSKKEPYFQDFKNYESTTIFERHTAVNFKFSSSDHRQGAIDSSWYTQLRGNDLKTAFYCLKFFGQAFNIYDPQISKVS